MHEFTASEIQTVPAGGEAMCNATDAAPHGHAPCSSFADPAWSVARYLKKAMRFERAQHGCRLWRCKLWKPTS